MCSVYPTSIHMYADIRTCICMYIYVYMYKHMHVYMYTA